MKDIHQQGYHVFLFILCKKLSKTPQLLILIISYSIYTSDFGKLPLNLCAFNNIKVSIFQIFKCYFMNFKILNSSRYIKICSII